MQHCRGHRPSQQINSHFLCDNTLDCIDRSDEVNCISDMFRQPKIRETQLDPEDTEDTEGWDLAPEGVSLKYTNCDPVSYNLSHPELCPYGEWWEWDNNCNKTFEQGYYITQQTFIKLK